MGESRELKNRQKTESVMQNAGIYFPREISDWRKIEYLLVSLEIKIVRVKTSSIGGSKRNQMAWMCYRRFFSLFILLLLVAFTIAYLLNSCVRTPSSLVQRDSIFSGIWSEFSAKTLNRNRTKLYWQLGNEMFFCIHWMTSAKIYRAIIKWNGMKWYEGWDERVELRTSKTY